MIYLEDEQFFLLKKAASQSKKRVSEIVREAIWLYFKQKKPLKDAFSFIGIAEGPQNGKTSEEAEEILKEILK